MDLFDQSPRGPGRFSMDSRLFRNITKSDTLVGHVEVVVDRLVQFEWTGV